MDGCDDNPPAGENCVGDITRRHPEITAAATINEPALTGIQRALERAGLDIPRPVLHHRSRRAALGRAVPSPAHGGRHPGDGDGGDGRRAPDRTHRHAGRPAQTAAVRPSDLGTIPDPAFAQAIFKWLGPVTSRPAWNDLPPSATATSGVGRAGRRIHFLHNWSWTTAQAAAPRPLEDVLSGARFGAGEPVPLGPWDVRILAEAQRQ